MGKDLVFLVGGDPCVPHAEPQGRPDPAPTPQTPQLNPAKIWGDTDQVSRKLPDLGNQGRLPAGGDIWVHT